VRASDAEASVTTTAGDDHRGRGFLASLPALQRTAIISAAVVGFLLVAGSATGLVLQMGSEPESTSARSTKPPVVVPQTETTPAPSASASETTPAGAASSAASQAVGSISAPVRAALIAFRRDGALWVSGENGANARSVVLSADGAFSLSPDGLTLAVVDASSGTLSVVTVATGASVRVGTAAQATPVWAPDSTWLVFRQDTDAGSDLVRVAREGAPARPLGAGSSPSISTDGAWVFAVLTEPVGTRRVVRIPADGGTAVQVPKGSSVTGVSETGVSAASIFFARPGIGTSTPTIGSMSLAGTGVKTLVKAPLSGTDVSFTSLRPSPDGTWLAYQESGDDGFSRLYCIRTAGGDPVKLWLRYDAYVIGWSANGTELLFSEGNTLQGETSRIVAVHPDGAGRRVVAENAGL
jgi:hypothetical protein